MPAALCRHSMRTPRLSDYLRHQSNRKDYVEAFFEVINWPEIEARYVAASEAPGKAEL